MQSSRDYLNVMTPSHAIELLGQGLFPEDIRQMSGYPIMAVATDSDEDISRFVSLTRDLPCVIVGVSNGRPRPSASESATAVSLDAFDVLLSPGDDLPPPPWIACPDINDALAKLTTSVSESPIAAVSLVQLLRYSHSLSVENAVVAESFVYSMLQSGPRFSQWLELYKERESERSKFPSRQLPPVLASRNGNGVDIQLNRPHVRNAINAQLRDALIDALRMVIADSSIESVKLSGNGPDFCSGGDLTEFGKSVDPATAHIIRITRSVGLWLARCAERVEASVHGSCIGAGIEIPAFARHVRATKEATFTLPEVTMGLIPGAGGTASITRRIGRQRSAFLALSGTPISARTALSWGLVDEIIS